MRLYGSFPKRWLWEGFEDELIQGKENCILQEKEKREMRKKNAIAKKAEKIRLSESIKSKLTKEELKFLKENKLK